MRILYVGSFRLPNKDAAAARVLNNAKAMHELGHSIRFLSWGGEYRESDLCQDGKYRVEGMEYVITHELDVEGPFFKRLRAMFERGKESYKLIKQESPKPDLIILYNADRGWTLKLLKYCNANDIKLANDITEWYDNNELHPWDILPYHINMTCTQHKVKNKILISNYLCNYYRGSNNLLLPPLCDQTEEKWSRTIEDVRIHEFEGVTLIYAGNPAKKDCVHTVINVVNELAYQGENIRFLIVGIAKETYIERYKQQLITNKLHENIIFLGRVSQDLIPAYYKFADFMVLLREPSRKNMAGFPTKFAESMSAGIPVIANCTSDLESYIHDNKTGFRVSRPNAQALKDVLENKVLKLSRPQIETMKRGAMSLKTAFNLYSYKMSIQSFLDNIQ